MISNRYHFIILIFYLSRNRFLKFYYRYFKLKQILLRIPYFKNKTYKKLKDITKSIEDDFSNHYKNIKQLPENPLNGDQIFMRLKSMETISRVNQNKISGVIYHGEEKHKKKLLKIFEQFIWSNPLHPELFPSIREMEIDIINMSINIFNGDNKCLGNVTSGGTESIILACKTYRDWARQEKGIYEPNIVALSSVHPAFDKACHYFNIKLIKVQVNKNGTTSFKNIKQYVNSNTICMVGSAPSYAHGIIDPIIRMSEFCYDENIGFHMDCCLGGFLVPFVKKSQFLDFRTKGMTSISLDTHKYGYSFKGSSVLLFRDYGFKKYQHYINPDWNGGMYGTPTILGSKSGAIISTAWASMLYMGRKHYTEIALKIQKAIRYIVKSFKNNEFIDIIGKPDINVVAFKSDKINIFQVIAEMKKFDWNLSVLQNPDAFHICVTNKHCDVINEFIKDLDKSVENVIKTPNKELSGTLALYGSSKTIEASLFTNDIIDNFIHLLSTEEISYIYEPVYTDEVLKRRFL